jgi:hypothetical protein
MQVPQRERRCEEERQTLRSGARIVNLKMKYFFLDSRAACDLGGWMNHLRVES